MDPDLTSLILFEPAENSRINSGIERVFGITYVLGRAWFSTIKEAKHIRGLKNREFFPQKVVVMCEFNRKKT